MIIDVQKFLSREKPFWDELDHMLAWIEEDRFRFLSFDEITRLHYLYERASAGLAKVKTFSSETEIRHYLESMVGRAFTVIYSDRGKAVHISPLKWLSTTFPRTFRKHFKMFVLSLALMIVGTVFGAAAVVMDPDAKSILMPFPHLQQAPAERVAAEEEKGPDALKDGKASFAAYLMTHNTRVSILAMALGMTWGLGTALLLLTNGIMFGAVAADYIMAGEHLFLAGWLLPHGAVEIPSILIAGQAGLVLAAALLGGGSGRPVKQRLRDIGPDLVTLIFGVGLMLIWAGMVEGFLSQYHEPMMPYRVKILFGTMELLLLCLYFGRCGKKSMRKKVEENGRIL